MRSEITASLVGRPVAAVQVAPLSVDHEAVPLLGDHTNPDPPAAIAMEPGPAEAPAGAVTTASMLCRRRRTRLRSAESATVSALSVFFPSNEVFVFCELREPLLKTSVPGRSSI